MYTPHFPDIDPNEFDALCRNVYRRQRELYSLFEQGKSGYHPGNLPDTEQQYVDQRMNSRLETLVRRDPINCIVIRSGKTFVETCMGVAFTCPKGWGVKSAQDQYTARINDETFILVKVEGNNE
jgi:hypothetical protein